MTSGPKEKAQYPHTRRNVICIVLMLAAGCGGFLFFNKGLYLLPDRVCDDSVDRGVVMHTLPNTRTAGDRTGQDGTGVDFMYSCVVSTSGPSRIDGNVAVQDASGSTWANNYGPLAGHRVVKTAEDGIEALAQIGEDADDGLVSVYVPCTPPDDPYDLDGKPDTKPHTYALITKVGVKGETRVAGAALRQELTDFAFQLTRHAYKLAGCEEPRLFPDQLPRYEPKSG